MGRETGRTLRRAMQVQRPTNRKRATAAPPMMMPTCCNQRPMSIAAVLTRKEARTTAVLCLAHQFPTAVFDAEDPLPDDPPFLPEMITDVHNFSGGAECVLDERRTVLASGGHRVDDGRRVGSEHGGLARRAVRCG